MWHWPCRKILREEPIGPINDLKPYLNGNGWILRPEKGIPVELSLELVPVLAVDKLEHWLVHHVRLQWRVWSSYGSQQWMDHNNSKFNLYNWRFLWQKDIAFKLVLKTKVMASQHIWLTNVYDQILRKFDTTIFSGSHQLQKTYSFPFSGSGGINSVNCFRILLEHIFNQTLSRFHNI